MTTTEAPRLSAEEIGRDYGAVTALDRVSLDIEPGEFLTLLGPSGSGKTTFLMILAGFVAPSRGRILDNGADITARPAEKRNYGMVFQGYALFPHMSVAENVAFPLNVRKLARPERKRRVGEMLDLVGLAKLADKRPHQLSGGQQQRVALARALVFEPRVLLLDEPFSALDKNLREQLQDEVRRLHRQSGTTFVFVTHDQSEALALSTRVAIFDHGKLEQVDSPDRVYDAPATRFVAEFLGRINILPLSDCARDGARLRGRFEAEALAAPAREMTGARRACLAVRPEHMRLGESKPNGGANAVAATVVERTYKGASTLVTLRSASGVALTIPVPSAERHAEIAPGRRLWVSWPAERSFILPEQEDA